MSSTVSYATFPDYKTVSKEYKTVKLGLLGCGNVGSGVIALVERNRERIAARTGLDLRIERALVRDRDRSRPGVARSIVTTSFDDVLDSADLVVEALGGLEPARHLVSRALERGVPVVTANKALLATHGREIFALAAERGTRVGFEASVCGAIPIVRALGDGLAGDRVQAIVGILNGTSNYVLSRMAEGATLEAAVALAQERGFAEADPSLDLDGHDAAQKLSILAALAFGARVDPASIPRQGISDIEPEDLEAARELGFAVKPLAIARDLEGELDLRVQPLLVPHGHPLASVGEEENGVLVRGEAAGELAFRGRGAGSLPTASAVLADVLDLARSPRSLDWPEKLDARPIARDVRSRHYLRFPVEDTPGAIGRVATALGLRGVSIASARARLSTRNRGSVVVLTHEAPPDSIAEALKEIQGARAVAGASVWIRGLV